MLLNPESNLQRVIPDRLLECLPGYIDRIPLYQGYPKPAEPVTLASFESFLHSLPLMTKHDIGHNFPRNFLPEGVELDSLVEAGCVELEQTSGTSQTRTPLLLPAGWWARQEARALRLNPAVAAVLDHDPAAHRVTINSPMCSNEICYTTVPTRAERTIGSALFLSLSRLPFLWSEADLSRMAAEASDWNPRFLDVDPVYGTVFALYCERKGLRLPKLECIVSSYSFLSQVHRQVMERVFGVPVWNLYGSTETGHLLMQLATGLMGPSIETAWLELVQPDKEGIGELVVTTLENDVMPLVRYRIGDLLERIETPTGLAYRLHGRTVDCFHLKTHRLTTLQVDNAFKGIEGISHYQFLERSGGHWLLRWAPDNSGPQTEAIRHLQRTLEQLTSGKVEVNQVESLLPEASGKFRLTCPLRRTV